VRHLLVGYSADVEIILAGSDAVLRIPTSALLPGNRVLLLGAESTLEERSIATGLSNWEFTEVKSGLARGERVVTSLERQGVKAGARVAAEAKTAAPAGK
jgi:HlyD family secretion protein